jgi:limonene-1,2-epoxide hydrolase
MMAPIDIVREFLAAWNANDMDRVVAWLHPDVRYHNVPLAPVHGREAVRAYLKSIGAFDWIDWKLLAIAADGNIVLTERIDEFGINGMHVRLPLMGAFEIRDGLIGEWRDYFDLAMYQRQLKPA